LRAAGIGAEVYPEAKKIGSQFQYAEKKGFKVALIAGGDEFAHGVWKLKDLARREETTFPTAEVPAAVRRVLENPKSEIRNPKSETTQD
jgi:histidyl-tRNA synthetase